MLVCRKCRYSGNRNLSCTRTAYYKMKTIDKYMRHAIPFMYALNLLVFKKHGFTKILITYAVFARFSKKLHFEICKNKKKKKWQNSRSYLESKLFFWNFLYMALTLYYMLLDLGWVEVFPCKRIPSGIKASQIDPTLPFFFWLF